MHEDTSWGEKKKHTHTPQVFSYRCLDNDFNKIRMSHAKEMLALWI